jgi:YVTN family beta-propeller protein
MTENLPPRGSPRRLRRYAIVPVCCGALAMSIAAAAPPGVHPDATLTPVATIAVGQDPTGLAVNQATGTAYVTCTGPTPDVYAIDEATNTVTATIPVGKYPQAVAVDQATNTVYVANYTGDTVSVIDAASNTVSATIPVVSHPFVIAVDPASDQIFAASNDGTSVIDGATNVVTATLPDVSHDIAVDPTTKRLWTAEGSTLEALSVKTYKVVATVKLADSYDVVADAVDPVTDTIYLATSHTVGHGVAVINGQAGSQTAFITLRGKPHSLAIDQQNDTLFAGMGGQLIEMSGKTDKATGTVTVNAFPVAVDGLTHLVYVGRYGSPTVYAYLSSPGKAG